MPTASAELVVSSCRALLAAVPAELDKDVRRRPVTGDAARTAAWGDPPVTLQCGVARAVKGIGPITIDGLSFLTNQGGGVVTWTTSDRAVNVAITIPESYEEQAYQVQPLIPAILKHLPAPGHAPGA